MKSVFLREQRRYTQNELIALFKCSEEKTISFIEKLKSFGILKVVKANSEQKNLSDLLEEDIEILDIFSNKENYFYVFKYVGVVILNELVLKCYPKYLLNVKEPKNKFKEVLKVLEKYNDKEQIIRMYDEIDENGRLNELAIIIFLLNDYYEYGIYSNTQDIIEVNGAREILWDKTINETFAFISNNVPFYPNLLTKKRVNNDFDYFKRLHEFIVSECSKKLKDANLLELFDLDEVYLSDEEIIDFGELDYVLYRINQELNIQFNTRKQQILKTMYAYINNSYSNNIDSFSIFGTNNFNLVWEKVCSEVLDNQLNKPLELLDLPVSLDSKYNGKESLKSLIEKPTWYGYKDNRKSTFNKKAKKTLIPDLISIVNYDKDYKFIIFDAKYYTIQLEEDKVLVGQPGVESVTKQYLYQLAFKNFIQDHKMKTYNCFLMPTETDEIIHKGFVSMDILEKVGLEKIGIYLMPASKMYRCYIQDKKIDMKELNFDI